MLIATFGGRRRHLMVALLGSSGVVMGAASIIAGHSAAEWRGEPVDGVRIVIAGVAAAVAWSIVVADARAADPARGALCAVMCSSLTWAAATDWAVPFALGMGVLAVAAGVSTLGVPGTSAIRLSLAAASLALAGGLSAGAILAGEWSLQDAVAVWPWAPAGAAFMALAAGALAGAGCKRRSLRPMVPTVVAGALLALYAAAPIPHGAATSILLVSALIASSLVAGRRYRVGAAASSVVLAALALSAAARSAAGLAAIAAIVGASSIATRAPRDTPSALSVALLPPMVGGAAVTVAASAAFDQVMRSASMSERLPWMAASILLPVMTGTSILIAGSLARPRMNSSPAHPRGDVLSRSLVSLAVVAGLVPAWLLPAAPDPTLGGAGLLTAAIGAGAWLAWWMKKHRVLPTAGVPDIAHPKEHSMPRALPIWLPAACDLAAIVLFIASAAIATWVTVAGARIGFL